MDALSLLLYVLVFILILGLVWWVASLLLPAPIPTVLLVVVLIIGLIWLLGSGGVNLR